MILVVTVENVDIDLLRNPERATVFERGVDEERLVGAEAVVRGDGRDKSHG